MDTSILGTDSKRVGPYTLTRRLGAGGMGEVWAGGRAHETGAYKTVAVKLLTPERANDENSQHMFDEEARLSMLLCNSNIVQVFDVGNDAGVHYMAMEWVDGLDLDELCKALRADGELLPLTVVGYVVGEILKALAYAHDFEHQGGRRTIVHRDVSAHNVMLSVAGEVKLMDFGIARVASEDTSGDHVKGKLRYMPPEQLRGDSRAPTIDLFAVGAILHELLDGKRFRSGVVDEARLYGMVFDGEVPPLGCAPARIPGELEALRRRLLEAKPEERIQSAREAHRYLCKWPGYRDAKFELQDIVRSQRNSRAVETAIVAPPSRLPAPAFGASSRVESRESSNSRERTWPPGSTDTGGTRETMPRSHTTATQSGARAMSTRTQMVHTTGTVSVAQRPGSTMLLKIGMVLLGVTFPALLFSWLVVRARPSNEQEQVQAPVGVPVANEPRVAEVQLPTPILIPTTPRVPTLAPPAPAHAPADSPIPPASGEQQPPLPTAETPPGQPLQASTKPSPSPRVVVSISAPTVFWLEVKIGSRVYSLDRMGGKSTAVARLRPGTYRVRYRSDAKGSFRPGTTLTIPAGQKSLELKWLGSGKFGID